MVRKARTDGAPKLNTAVHNGYLSVRLVTTEEERTLSKIFFCFEVNQSVGKSLR